MHFTRKEQIRIDITARYIDGDISSFDASQILEISERQLRRLVKAFREEGVLGICHGNKGRSPSNKTSDALIDQICDLYRSRYYDLSVRHFIEKLYETEGLKDLPCYTTIRTILLKNNLVDRKNKRARKSFRRRNRCEKEGIMVQIDGSHHHWIQGHNPFCLTAAIDDATGEIVGAHFSKTETTFAAMNTVEEVLKNKGSFHMLYSDKAGIYGGGKRQYFSQMSSAMKELNIYCVQANSPQAKGRVERLFGTLQGRLVQELRLNGVRTIGEANGFLKEYLPKFNARFKIKPRNPVSAYKKLNMSIKELNELMVVKEYRKIHNGNVINYNSDSFVIEDNRFLTNKTVELRLYRNGETSFIVDGEKLSVQKLIRQKRVA